ncbi:MAG: lysylphosphatidylglycerol synthase transmembrane domain-containing protein [Pseudomonadota bacterium]
MSSSRLNWVLAVCLTLILFGVLFRQVEISQLWAGFSRIPGWCIAAAFLLFVGEGVISTWRILACAATSRTQPRVINALSANGWWVLLVLALPARLGEVAAIAVVRRDLDMSVGAAAMSIVFQRMLDVICLVALSIVLLTFAYVDAGFAMWAGLVASLVILLLLSRIEGMLTWAARLVVRFRQLFRPLIQARRWRRQLTTNKFLRVVVLTVFKWLFTFSGIGVLIYGFASLDTGQALGSTAVYSLGSAVPIHGLGGVGIGEYSLAGVLQHLAAVDTPTAVATALGVRFFIISFGVCFFLFSRVAGWFYGR